MGPLDMHSYVPTSYTEAEVLQEIKEGKRPAPDQITRFFWAPGEFCPNPQTSRL